MKGRVRGDREFEASLNALSQRSAAARSMKISIRPLRRATVHCAKEQYTGVIQGHPEQRIDRTFS